MRNIRRYFLSLSLCCLALLKSSFSFAESSDLTIYFEENYYPYTFTVNGQLDGINAIMITKACEIAAIQCRFVEMPWSRAMATVMTDPQSGILSASRNSSREPFFRWVGPVMSGDTMYFKLKSRTDIQIQKPEDVLNYTIGVGRGDIYESVLLARGFKMGENLLQTPDKSDPMRLFLVGRLDLMFASGFTLPRVIKQFDGKISDLEAVAWLRTPELKGNYLALNRSVPGATEKRLNDALEAYRKTKDFNHLVNRFRPPEIIQPTF